jgi:hypothetical protein
MEDGTIIDTNNAKAAWKEATDWDGNNHVSRNAGRFNHQRLYCSRKGRYYLECWSGWQGSMPHAEWVSPQEAARWLLLNDEELPEDLAALEEQVSE